MMMMTMMTNLMVNIDYNWHLLRCPPQSRAGWWRRWWVSCSGPTPPPPSARPPRPWVAPTSFSSGNSQQQCWEVAEHHPCHRTRDWVTWWHWINQTTCRSVTETLLEMGTLKTQDLVPTSKREMRRRECFLFWARASYYHPILYFYLGLSHQIHQPHQQIHSPKYKTHQSKYRFPNRPWQGSVWFWAETSCRHLRSTWVCHT